jgi:hypothetical protein
MQKQENLPPRPTLITLPLTEFTSLSLRQDDYIEISSSLAILISELDNHENLTHVESPNSSNNLKRHQLWNIKAWRSDLLYREKARVKSAEDKVLFENMKLNHAMIAFKLKELTKLPDANVLLNMAVEMLKNNPDNVDALGIELKKPYYKGVYQILPQPRELR